MAQILQPTQTVGDLLSQQLQQNLGPGLQMLAQHRLGQILQREQQAKIAKGLEGLGIHPSMSSAISILPESLQRDFLKDYMSQASLYQKKTPLDQMLGSLQPDIQSEEMLPEAAPELVEKKQIAPKVSTISKQIQKQKTEPEKIKLEEPALIKEPKIATTSPKVIEQNKKVAETAKELPFRLTKAQQFALAKERMKTSLTEQREIDKETKPFYTDIKKTANATRASDRRLNRMEELVKRGKLSMPAWHSFLNTLSNGILGFGIDLHSLESADSQEFSKLTQDFVKEIKDIFGARITDTDLKTFLKTVPNLSMSREGKLRVINNLRAANEANRIKNKAMDSIIAANNGRRPRNLETLVEEATSDQLDTLAEAFRKGTDERNKTGDFIESLGLDNPLDIISFFRG